MRLLLPFLFLLVSLTTSATDISGKITNTNGEALPFASVYLKGTSIGTTSNEEGFYKINIEQGNQELVFQYVGYQLLIKQVKVEKTAITLDVQLQETDVKLPELEISSKEDPAYRVIRQAIAKRKYYKNQVEKYSCKAYIKGTQTIKNPPEKIMGIEIGNLDGLLDSNMQGIIYLSESVSEVFYQRPDNFKEKMISSKISGDDNGFSFNQASMFDFDFYQSSINFNRAIVSPIADNAFSFYKYQLEGYFLENDYKINKIKVIPKNKFDPAVGGYIYIVEDLWNIHSTDLWLTRHSAKVDILDTLNIKQIYVPIKSPDVWMQFSNTIDFKIAVFLFDVEGRFIGIFKDYNLDIEYPDDFFDNEVLKIEDGANKKTVEYWDSTRPVMLTEAERSDYIKKDSLLAIYSSPAFIDSMDRVNNRFAFSDLISGYTYNQTRKRQSFSVRSPINTVQFNTVQGFTLDLNVQYQKKYNEEGTRWLSLRPSVQYGFSDQEWRGSFQSQFKFNEINFSKIDVSVGNVIQQFNEENPICTFCNTAFSLFGRLNFIRLYEKQFAKIGYEQELLNGLFFKGSVEYALRNSVANTTDFYLTNPYQLDIYDPNFPFSLEYEEFSSNNALTFQLSFRIRFDQKYVSYPKKKIISRSKYPDIWLHYRKGIDPTGNGETNYDRLRLSISDEFKTGIWGYSNINLEGGLFLNNQAVPFPDFFHFNGNETSFTQKSLDRSFFSMPYYDRSSQNAYVMLHYQHNFNGLILSKLPVFKRLGWGLVTGVKAHYTPTYQDYFEVHAGFNKIGWGLFRMFRLDFSADFLQQEFYSWNINIGYDF